MIHSKSFIIIFYIITNKGTVDPFSSSKFYTYRLLKNNVDPDQLASDFTHVMLTIFLSSTRKKQLLSEKSCTDSARNRGKCRVDKSYYCSFIILCFYYFYFNRCLAL